jgi:hypothetical protein
LRLAKKLRNISHGVKADIVDFGYQHGCPWIKTKARQVKKYMVGFNLVSDRRV